MNTTSYSLRIVVLAILFAVSFLLPSVKALAEQVSFIACPVYRDTDAGPKSGCWLANDRDSGATYDIGSGLTKPIGDRAVLVEGISGGTSAEDIQLCGGMVLSPVRVSVLEDSCQPHIIPAEDHPGRVFRPPGELMQPLSVARSLPEPPFENRTFSILFNYNSDFLNYQYSEVILEKVSLYIKASKAARVDIVAYAATEPLWVSNQELRESLDLAKARAGKVQTALLRLGVDASRMHSDWQRQGNPTVHYAGGLAQETLRRVDIIITVSD